MNDHQEVLDLANTYHNTKYEEWCDCKMGKTCAVELLLESGYLEVKDGILFSRYK
jgi:hypothetical protein